MEFLITAAKTMAIIVAMTLIIPLMIWGGTGSFKGAMQAWATYWKIMGTISAVVIGFALIMTVAEHGVGVLAVIFH